MAKTTTVSGKTPTYALPSGAICIKREEFAASDELPYNVTITGLDRVTGFGDSPEEAWNSLVRQLANYIKCARACKEAVKTTIGPI